MQFEVDCYTIKRISRLGAWMVSTESPVDLGLLFLRPQEFYECSNPEFVGQAFSVEDYIRWYAKGRGSLDNVFSYFDDFTGYNIPGPAIAKFFEDQTKGFSRYDILFARIAEAVKVLQNGDYYLIGSCKKSAAEHEIAHAMYYLMPAYRTKANDLIDKIDENSKKDIFAKLADEGYSGPVILDETQAYMSTGLFEELDNYEPLRLPFIKNFKSFRRKFVDREPKKNDDEKKPD